MASSKTGTWFQGPEAYSFYESLPDLFQPFVLGVASLQLPPKGKRAEHHPSLQERTEDRLILRGVCVGYVTVEKSAVRQFFTRRAIILGGPALADDCTDAEVIALLEAVKTKTRNLVATKNIFNLYAPIYIETRNFNDYSKWKDAFAAAEFDYRPHLNFHVDPSTNNLSDNRCRQIRRACEAGATTMMIDKMSAVEPLNDEAQIREQPTQTLPKGKADMDVTEAEIKEWYEILRELYRTKVKTPLWPVEFFLEAYRQGVGKFLLVKYEGKVIGGNMVVVWKPTSDSSLKGRGEQPTSDSSLEGREEQPTSDSSLKGREEQPTSDSSLKGREDTAQESFARVWGAHTADSTQYNLLKENAVANRKTPTEAESVLWDMLKSNNIGLHFRRQHIILDYIVDFICLDKGLVIELDGGYHNNPEQKEYDKQRTAHLQRLGYRELRFSNEELLVNPDGVVAKIKAVASQLPSLKGRTEDKPASGAVYEWFECGMNAEYKEQYPSVMATWAGIQWAKENGCARYDMMGAGEPGVPYGVRDFKSEFGGKMVEHGRFLCVNKPMLYRIGALAVRILRKLK